MHARLLLAATAALLVASGPAFAIETVTLPQNSDGTPAFQNPAAPADQGKSQFSTDQNGNMKVEGLGTFHFSGSQGSGWPGDPDESFRTGRTTGDAFGDSKTPGSEFYNPLGH
ncbi:MAG TPA: hypothetical protein VGL35_05685 [Rhizomicrobium sp.]|jgi:hypothetical protein